MAVRLERRAAAATAVDVASLPHRITAPLADQPVEICVIVYFAGDGRPCGMRHVRGSRGGVEMSVRQLVADALSFDAHEAVVAHNHPSGDPAPSEADLAFTRRLARGFEAIGVRLRDHVVVARTSETSLRAEGYL